MNKDLFDQHLREYVREALIYGDKDVDEAANYLLNQRKPGFLSKTEKKDALVRARKNILSLSRSPPVVCNEMPGIRL